MDFLLDPNFAYLILLAGIILTLLAVVTPGTGVLEISAIFCFLLAGYAIYNLSINGWALGLLALSVIPFVYASKTGKKIFLAISILLLVTGSVFLFGNDEKWISVHPLVALLASGILAGSFWLVALKFLQTLATRPMHDLESLVGQVGESRTVVFDDGSVYVNGELWSARSDIEIPKASHIRVVRREGFTLVVEKIS